MVWLLGRRNPRLGLAYALSFVALPGAWVIRNSVTMGVAAASTQGSVLIWHGNNVWARGSFNADWDDPTSPQRAYLRRKFPGFEQRSEAVERAFVAAETRSDLRSHSRHILWLLPRKVLLFFSPVSYLGWDWPYLLFAGFAPVGLLALWHGRATREVAAFLVLPIAGTMVSAMVTFGDPRFRHPVDALVVVLGSFGLCHLTDRYHLLPRPELSERWPAPWPRVPRHSRRTRS